MSITSDTIISLFPSRFCLILPFVETIALVSRAVAAALLPLLLPKPNSMLVVTALAHTLASTRLAPCRGSIGVEAKASDGLRRRRHSRSANIIIIVH